ncbi:TIGR03086 family protein [Nocardioides marmoriginsengisoli]|uniref:TIGR03086 family protein n=1 Tax=Nocardioides marmoriginsengisoli TaxID=661483 RepID=A0A3N0CF29_9ACTN|nr:TIGR03086 family metal-binding protein [Nocardioides marmoriginsengisoli]RNL62067.1 TIGR03086 family protein [Nocardioides marmoriginsengisoli]
MPTTPSAADDHRAVAGLFSDLVGTTVPLAWDNQSPVREWKARDVVGHLVEWFPGFLESGAGITLPAGPSAADDPVGAWRHHAAAVQAVLDDPTTAGKVLTNPHLGEVPLDQAIANFYTSDVFLHTWDLARATGQPVALDEDRCAAMLAGMEPMDEVLRQSGQYGPRIDVPAGADAQSRLMGFIGRDPQAWS